MVLVLAGCGAAPSPATTTPSAAPPGDFGTASAIPLPSQHEAPATPPQAATSSQATQEGPCPRKKPGADRSIGAADGPGGLRAVLTVLDGWNGKPVEGEPVLAIREGGEAIDWWTFDFDPFFNPCVVARAVTDATGKATFDLRPDLGYLFAHSEENEAGHRSSRYTAEYIPAGPPGQTAATLRIYPKSVALDWDGTFETVDPLGAKVQEVRHVAVAAGRTDVWDRWGTFSPDNILFWNNTPVSSADLYLGMAAGGDPMFTDDFFNDEQAMDAGAVREEGFGHWIDLGVRGCGVREKGLALVAYDAGYAVATPAAPVAFHWRMEFELESPVTPFLKGLDC
jgi:hypothetical protein